MGLALIWARPARRYLMRHKPQTNNNITNQEALASALLDRFAVSCFLLAESVDIARNFGLEFHDRPKSARRS